MENNKDWYKSKTIWSAIVSLSSLVAGAVGYYVSTEDQLALITILTSIGSGVGSLLTMYFRYIAKETIKPIVNPPAAT